MKRVLSALLLVVMMLVFAGCATNGAKVEGQRVKCPACGYEFNVPATD